MAHDVFISYSSKDKPAADAVCAALESHGVRCWIAPRDILPGMEWSEAIVEAIENARIMVLVFSAHANDSPQIRREVERAVTDGLSVLPFRIEDVLPARGLEYFIGTVHWLDALTPPLDAHLAHLVATVKVLLERPDLRAGRPESVERPGHPPAHPAPAPVPAVAPLPEAHASVAPTGPATPPPAAPRPAASPAFALGRAGPWAVAAVCATLAIVAIAFAVMRPGEPPVNRSATATVVGGPVGPTPNPTNAAAAVAGVPSPTPSVAGAPAVTVSPTSPPVPTPAVAMRTVLSASFDDARTGPFPAQSGQAAFTFAYEGGEFVIRKVVPDNPLVSAAQLNAIYGDSAMAVDMRLVGDNRDRYLALGCRTTPGPNGYSEYLFAVRPDSSSFGFFRLDPNGSAATALVPFKASDAIRGGSEWNRLELECVGPTMIGRANGVDLFAQQDSTYTSGLAWLGADSMPGLPAPVEVHIDNLVVSVPVSATPGPSPSPVAPSPSASPSPAPTVRVLPTSTLSPARAATATAIARQVVDYEGQLAASGARRVFGPVSGELQFRADGQAAARRAAGVPVRGAFASMVSVAVPADTASWDAGYLFKTETGGTWEFRVTSSGAWEARLDRDGTVETRQFGRLSSVRSGRGESNVLQAVVGPGLAFFSVNGERAPTITLPAMSGDIEVSVASGIASESRPTRGSTSYDGFTVWQVDLQ